MTPINNDIYYLIHCTNNPYYNNFDCLNTSNDYERKFPGVYFSLVTKWNLESEIFHLGDTMLLFSVELLQQKNYHINCIDMNGIISEHNTYFPWEMDKFLKLCRENNKIKSHRCYNEVVFHDPIPMKYMCHIIKKPVFIPISNVLPNYQIKNEHLGDYKLLPFYCYYDCSHYKGLNMSKHNSNEWTQMMNDVCSTDLTNQNAYIERMKYLMKYRENQNLKYLYVFTASR